MYRELLCVLVSRFKILKESCRLWFEEDMRYVMKECSLHQNMIVEARRDGYASNMIALQQKEDAQRMLYDEQTFKWKGKPVLKKLRGAYFNESTWAQMLMRRTDNVTDTIPHFSVKNDLIEHTWARRVEFN